jgi:hypothetical protein
VFLACGTLGVSTFTYAENLPSLEPLPTPDVKTVYQPDKTLVRERKEFPIEMGTLSSKLFEDNLVLEEGEEKIKYTAPPQEVAEKPKPVEMSKKEESRAKPEKTAEKAKPKPVQTAKATDHPDGTIILLDKTTIAPNKQPKEIAKADYPSGTIILLDKTVIKPDQKAVASKTKTKSATKVASKAEKKTYTIKVPKVKITYLADESEVAGQKRKKLLQFVRELRKKDSGNVKIVTEYKPVPFQEEGEEVRVAENRVKYVKAFMREQGVNPEKYNFSTVHKKSADDEQYLQIEFTG